MCVKRPKSALVKCLLLSSLDSLCWPCLRRTRRDWYNQSISLYGLNYKHSFSIVLEARSLRQDAGTFCAEEDLFLVPMWYHARLSSHDGKSQKSAFGTHSSISRSPVFWPNCFLEAQVPNSMKLDVSIEHIFGGYCHLAHCLQISVLEDGPLWIKSTDSFVLWLFCPTVLCWTVR